MRFAYADPPYMGQCARYQHFHPDGLCWDDESTHNLLIEQLEHYYPDGWAMSASSPSLRTILPMCPPDVRVAAWVKPFAAFKRNVRNAYTWEPVILRGGRLSSKDGAPVTRDHLSQGITLRRGLTGAKPPAFCRWILAMLGYVVGDQVDDLFPGTGVMGEVLAQRVLALGAKEEGAVKIEDRLRRAAKFAREVGERVRFRGDPAEAEALADVVEFGRETVEGWAKEAFDEMPELARLRDALARLDAAGQLSATEEPPTGDGGSVGEEA